VDREYVLLVLDFVCHLPHSLLGNNDREEFRIISGILRLSTKYLIDSLRSKILDHLQVAWPTNLEAWDTREELARAYEAESGLHRGLMYPSPIVSFHMFHL
jgi:hypothetical protein